MKGMLLIAHILLFQTLVFWAHGQQPGFVSIDCGHESSYADKKTGLIYTPDAEFINTGVNHKVASEFINKADYFQANDLRSFPNGTRNCYNLPTVKGKKYLIRTFFMYGNYDGHNLLPQFDLYLGPNLWYHFKIENASINYYSEIITVSAANSVSVCLLNRDLGVPFISSLELRPISDSIYKEVSEDQSLVLYSPMDCGDTRADKVRYPDDEFDRIWVPYTPSIWRTLNTSNKINTNNNLYHPSSSIMATAVSPKKGSTIDITWTVDFKWTKDAVGPPYYYIFLHFAEIQLLNANESRKFDVKLNDEILSSNVSPKYLTITTITNKGPHRYKELEFSISKTNDSTLPPILNAFEIYTVSPLTEKNTDSRDVDAIMDIKSHYQIMRNWMGDPCSPKDLIWNGLKCSYDTSKPPRIINLNLSSSGLRGELLASIANLTGLQYLDLSMNDLGGKVPDSFGSLSELTFLNLTGNRLQGPLPRALLAKSQSGSLKLSFEEETSSKSKKIKTIVAASISSGLLLLLIAIVVICRLKRNKKDENQSGSNVKSKVSSLHFPSFQSESKHYTYNNLVNITNNFEEVLGKGGFGTVYYGVLRNGNSVAVKMLSQSSSQGSKEFQNEVQLLTRIHHRNLVPLIGCCTDDNHLALVFECMIGGTLQSHLTGEASKKSVLPWSERLRIALEVAQGLEYLHKGCKPAIVHRDIKTNNILLNENMEARIADFGLSRIFQDDVLTHVTTNIMGTTGYLDPEYYLTNKLNEKSDVYSFGIVLLELITGLPAIIKEGDHEVHIVQWIQPNIETGDLNGLVDHKLQGKYDNNSAWKALEIALTCIPSVALQRPTMSEVVMLLKECLNLVTPDIGSSRISTNDIEATYGTSTSTGTLTSFGNFSTISENSTSHGISIAARPLDVSSMNGPPAR